MPSEYHLESNFLRVCSTIMYILLQHHTSLSSAACTRALYNRFVHWWTGFYTVHNHSLAMLTSETHCINWHISSLCLNKTAKTATLLIRELDNVKCFDWNCTVFEYFFSHEPTWPIHSAHKWTDPSDICHSCHFSKQGLTDCWYCDETLNHMVCFN